VSVQDVEVTDAEDALDVSRIVAHSDAKETNERAFDSTKSGRIT
jgi:hypothetical protein